MKRLIVIFIAMLVQSCNDEELMFERIPYLGAELKIDGYFYKQDAEKTNIKFFYRNGIMIDFFNSFPTIDLRIVDEGIAAMYERCKNDKLVWNVF